MDVNDEHVQTLLAMGFPRESEIRRALQIGKNDLNEAVSILTNDTPVSSYDNLDDLDVEMKDVQHTSTSSTFPPPPSYDEVLTEEQEQTKENDEKKPEAEETGLEFPVHNLYELENRVFTESWSIPYKRDESLGKCLLAATRLASEGLAETDQQCVRFLDRCMPECFLKLLNSGAVHRWGPDIQEGIYDMLMLYVDLVATRLKHQPVPINMLNTLALAFNADTEYHAKNKARKPDKNFWEDKLGVGKLYAMCPSPGNYKDFGYLTNLINKFASLGGFDSVKEYLAREDVDAPALASLLAPFGNCAEYLHSKVVLPLLSPGMDAAVKYVRGLTEEHRKDKRVGAVADLLASMKLLCLSLWPQDVRAMDDLRLEVALSMLKSPHFNAKMNGLKEVTKLIDDSCSTKSSKTAIPQDKIIDWLVDCKVLSIALEGNIDQAQYCDKIKNIVDFLGSQLSPDELTKIWKMQNGQNNVVVDNIHSIIAAAGVKFNAQLLEHLFSLIHSTWNSESNSTKEKLLNLIGRIGRDSINTKTTQKVLELLWDLAHLPQLCTGLVDLALEEHLAILSDSHNVKEQLKRTYVVKCVDDIKEGKWVLPALKQLLQIAKNIAKHSFNKVEKGILQELNKSYDIIKQVTNSLVKLHQQAVENAGPRLTPDTLVDRRYSHKDYVTVQLQFLQFILQEGVLYLPSKCAKSIWTTLIANPDACYWDRETCFEWLRTGIADLEQDTQAQLFQQEFLKLKPEKLTTAGFKCFKLFFENVNVHEHRMKKSGVTMIVEKPDLIGLDFLWEACLNTPNEEISESAISLLINMSYTSLAPRIKKDSIALHTKFIDACYKRLEIARLPLGGSLVAQCLLDANRIITSFGVPGVNTLPSPSKQSNLLSIERLLLLAECYVTTVEEQHSYPRTILAHGAAFQGQPLTLYITCEAPRMDFNITVHSNETVGSLRHKIAGKLKHAPDNVQIVVNDKVLNKEQKLLHQLSLEDNQVVCARAYTPSSSSSMSTCTTNTSTLSSACTDASSVILAAASVTTAKSSFELEQERQLPGVVMATGGHVFDMLYQLADLDEPKITSRARNLLKLIPTDPSVQDTLDSLGQKPPRQPTPEPPSPRLSPRNSPRKSTAAAAAAITITPTLTPSTSTSSLHKSSKEVLRSLFDPTAQDMSTFRVLYNLEVLSSKLMPPVRDTATLQTAAAFCDDFLTADGLALVVHTLQRDAIPADVDYESRQGCYAISLQLLRFLLCGQEVTGESFHVSINRSRSRNSSSTSAASTEQQQHQQQPTTDVTIASKAIQTMTVGEFTDTVGCFLRVAWAAAAGNLQLATSASAFLDSVPGASPSGSAGSSAAGQAVYGTRSRQSSTGSNTSTGSGDDQSLQPGVCARHSSKVSARDSTIAKEALELLVTCLQLRNGLLASFYSLPCAGDFIIDLLVGCSQEEIRDTALDQFYLLSQTEVPPSGGGGGGGSSETSGSSPAITPHHFMLHTLLKARLPFWVQSSSTRGASQRLLRQCKQYFELRCRMLRNLSESYQQKLKVNIPTMLDDEIGWLQNFVPSDQTRETDNVLLAGHLRMIHTLLTCYGVDKREIGQSLVHSLLHDLLFPASKLILDSMDNKEAQTTTNFNQICSTSESRIAAYDVLAELADGSYENLREVCTELTCMHHRPDPEMANEWEYMPPVDSRSSAGFVGLRNGGATCYMNSVMQQLFMTPGVVESILSVEDTNPGTEDTAADDTVLFQLQTVLGHLLESKLQYYVPEKFWKVFRLWGQTINIREQQDAFDFYTALLDQVEERLKKIGKDSVFKKKFQGVYSDQKICKDCPHRYEREEVFFALNVTVKNATLQDSLAQFVKGELLDGDNAYFCEKCGKKRDTIKRMCIKNLPAMLCIQLKRFSWDWETNRALKFDDHFKFPWTLDMEPYTAEGLARQEEALAAAAAEEAEDRNRGDDGTEDGAGGDGSSSSTFYINTSSCNSTAVPSKQIQYELVGVVVHSGQANAGHYYSFIKDRRGSHLTNQSKGKWFKFNDTVVEEFEMTDSALEAECFGGTYKTKVYEQSSSYPEERLRYWNGYLLFYEKVEEVRTPMSAKKSRVSLRSKPPHAATASTEIHSISKRSSDSLVELTELVHKGEKRGLFAEKMPARIQQVVRAENLRFMKNRDIYDSDYFRFVRQLLTKNIPSEPSSTTLSSELCMQSLDMGVGFLLHTYLRTKKKLRADLDDWVVLLQRLVERSKDACMWLVEYLSSSKGRTYIKPFLLECPSQEIREAFGQMLERTIRSFFLHGAMPTHKCFDELIEVILSMLTKDVPDNCKTCTQYFSVLAAYVTLGTKACSHMFGRQAFPRLMRFLLGSQGGSNGNAENGSGGTNGGDGPARRWSSLQARDFGPLHSTLATLVLNCDLEPYRTEAPGESVIVLPSTLTPTVYLKMSPEMQQYAFGAPSARYLGEVVLALREVGEPMPAVQDMLIYGSFCNSNFSMNVIKNIMRQYATAPSNELRAPLSILMSLLTLDDPLQLKRLQCVIDGYQDEHDVAFEGMLTVIKSNASTDSRRSYQLIKFLVSLSNRCVAAKDYLLQSPINWHWSVNWLKKKMTEHYWTPSTASTMSNEDSSSKTFQRTISAQTTLDEATDMLKEFEAQDPIAMETAVVGGAGGEGPTPKEDWDAEIQEESTEKTTGSSS